MKHLDDIERAVWFVLLLMAIAGAVMALTSCFGHVDPKCIVAPGACREEPVVDAGPGLR